MKFELLERLALRGVALVSKFILAICIAKYIGLAAVGIYGLAVGFAVVGTKIFGLGFSAEINRRLGYVGGRGILLMAGKIVAFYGSSYFVVGLISSIALFSPLVNHWDPALSSNFWIIFGVVIAEHLSFELNTYIFSMHKTKLGSWLLFMRTGGWAVIAIATLASASITGIEGVFRIWILSDLLVVCVAAGVLLSEYSAADVGADLNLGSLGEVWAGGRLFFISIAIISAMQYLERFLASPHLSQDQLGRYVFVWSIANALQTISNAVIVVVATPRLAKAAGLGDRLQYSRALKSALRSCLILTSVVAAVVIVMFRPALAVAHIAIRPADSMVMIVLLLSFIIRSICDIFVAAAIATCSGNNLLFATGVLAGLGVPLVWFMCQIGTEVYVAVSHLLVSAVMLLVLYFFAVRPAERLGFGEKVSAVGC